MSMLSCLNTEQLSMLSRLSMVSLSKRRVSELLADDIPEDEALIMKNGRLCCMVCYHHPTFDTLEMLSIHRGGKKHESHALVFYRKQKQLEDLKEKRRHELYVNGDTTVGICPARASSNSSFLKREPYNPQVKRKRLKPNERRQALQITPEDPATTKEPIPDATILARLPGNHRPYQSLHNPATVSQGSECITSHKRRAFGGNNKSVPETKNPNRVGPNQKLPQTISEYIKQTAATNLPRVSIKPYMRTGPLQDQSTAANLTLNCSPDIRHEQSTSTSHINPRDQTVVKVTKVGPISKESPPVPEVDEVKKQTAQKYLQATSSGWKLDWTRQKWIRDEDVEFDSDEEPPELPS